MCNKEKSSCIAEILSVINILQQNADCDDTCLDSCDKGFLGSGATKFKCNTRPVVLYTCAGNGVPFSMPVSKTSDCQNTEESSCVFRVEKLDDNCATFRVLKRNRCDTESSLASYTATNSFFTMNLDCCCAIRCLNDTFVDCI